MLTSAETVTRLRRPLITDPYSAEDIQADWSAAVETAIPGCFVADGGSTEPAQLVRESVTADFDVLMPTGADVTPQDRLRIRGLECDVVGRPFHWQNPFTGWQAGWRVGARIVEG